MQNVRQCWSQSLLKCMEKIIFLNRFWIRLLLAQYVMVKNSMSALTPPKIEVPLTYKWTLQAEAVSGP